eukprot:11231553-Heterocapsa_arctica.AAC.1
MRREAVPHYEVMGEWWTRFNMEQHKLRVDLDTLPVGLALFVLGSMLATIRCCYARRRRRK